MNEYNYDLSFRLRHPHLDPDIICEELGLAAKYKWKFGDPRRTPKGDLLTGTYQESYCSFQLSHEVGVGLLDLISDMNLKLRSHKAFLEKVYSSGGAAEYFVGIYFDGVSGETFNFKILAELAELKIDLALDLYGENK